MWIFFARVALTDGPVVGKGDQVVTTCEGAGMVGSGTVAVIGATGPGIDV